jgi:S-layer protein (TIGR01567 family)
MKSFSLISLIRILLALALTTGAVASASECIDISHTTKLTCQNFAGFYRDSDQNICTESLEFRPSNIDPSKLTATLSNEPDQNGNRGVVYQTKAEVKSFAFKPFSSYKVIGVLGEPYLAGFIPPDSVDEINFLERNSLCKVLQDSDSETKISDNVPLQLDEGYQLDLKSVDEIGNKVYLELSKNGAILDSKAISPNKDDATDLDKTYFYKNPQVGNQKKLVTIIVHFKTAFRGADQNMAIVDGIFQISDTPISIRVGEEFGMMSINSIDPKTMTLTMDNKDQPIALKDNECSMLMNINDSDVSVSYQFPTNGNIFVTSNPSGAEVLVDGVSKGLANPSLNISGLNPGSHKLLCRLARYNDSEKEVTVVSGVTTPEVCNLIPSTGNISVTSNPSGAEVLLDGTSMGFANPTAEISGLNPGSHKILCRLAGYKDFDIDATVEAGVTTPVLCTLIPLGPSTLSIIAEPAMIKPNEDAKIIISVAGPDGSPLSQTDVVLSAIMGGSFDKSGGMTDNQGRFSSNFTADTEGKYVVKAIAKTTPINEISNEVIVEVSSSAPGPVNPSTGYNPLITSIFAISMIMVMAGYLKSGRRRS